jgi:hypothetical protein
MRVFVALLSALVFASVCGCSQRSGGANAGSDSGAEWVAPKAIPPSVPGYVVAGPQGLELAVGQSAQLTATIYDGPDGGAPLTGATWSSVTPSVVTVTNAGVVDAVAVGVGEVQVTDGVHGQASLSLLVLASPPPAGQPIGAQFSPPLLVLQPGTTQNLAVEVTDGTGTQISPTPAVQFAIEGDGGVATVSGAGVVHAIAPGVATVTASTTSSDGGVEPLAGAAEVIVSSNGHPPNCQSAPYVVGCIYEFPPWIYTKPGLSDSVRVWVWREKDPCSGVAPPVVTSQEQSPDQVRIDPGGVVSIDGSGLLRSIAPGSTSMAAKVENVVCGPYPTTPVFVDPDYGGSWSATCSNGDNGTVALDYWPSWVLHGSSNHEATGGSTALSNRNTPGNSCFSNSAASFSCNGSASLYSFYNYGGAHFPLGACTAKTPCDNHATPGFGLDVFALNECGATRHGYPCNYGNGQTTCQDRAVLGPDTLQSGTCVLQRTVPDAGCGQAAPTETATWTLDGKSHTGTPSCDWQTGCSFGLSMTASDGSVSMTFPCGLLVPHMPLQTPDGGPITLQACSALGTVGCNTPSAGGAIVPSSSTCEYDIGTCDAQGQNCALNGSSVTITQIGQDPVQRAIISGTFSLISTNAGIGTTGYCPGNHQASGSFTCIW